MDINIYYRFICLMVSVGGFLSSIEYLANWKFYQNGGVFSWEVLSQSKLINKWYVGRQVSNLVLGYPCILGVFLLRAIGFLGLFTLSILNVGYICIPITIVLFTSLLTMYRQTYGGEGSDQMLMISLIPLFIHYVGPGNLFISQIGLYFITFQSCLSYVTSGFAKLISPVWRRGNALHLIMKLECYGYEPFAKFLENKDLVRKLLSWGIIVIECAYLIILLLPDEILIIIISFTAFMHISIAFIMGLNIFPWNFIATYSAILYTRYQL